MTTLHAAAKVFRDAFKYDPGHSDLDNEQPITVFVTLGDWRRLDYALRGPNDEFEMPNAIWLAKFFHDAYERLAPQYGYETRQDTKQFDHESPNGRLMAAVCEELRKAISQPFATGGTPLHLEVERQIGALLDANILSGPALALLNRCSLIISGLEGGEWNAAIEASANICGSFADYCRVISDKGAIHLCEEIANDIRALKRHSATDCERSKLTTES